MSAARFSSSNTTAPENGIASIALNNPSRRNALSSSVLQSLRQQLENIKANRNARVIIIKALDDYSQHNGVFSSGHDLNELRFNAEEEDEESYRDRLRRLFSLCSSVMADIASCPIPTIAQVDGIATAAGCQLVASCDLAVATSTSRFATPGVNIRLFCSTPAVPLVRTVAKKHATEMLLTGDMISAQRAYEIGLINRVVGLRKEDGDNVDQIEQQILSKQLDEEVQKLALKIAGKSSSCIQTGLRTLYVQQTCASLEDAYKLAEANMVENLLDEDAAEGIDAFLGKRKPNWRK